MQLLEKGKPFDAARSATQVRPRKDAEEVKKPKPDEKPEVFDEQEKDVSLICIVCCLPCDFEVTFILALVSGRLSVFKSHLLSLLNFRRNFSITCH